MEVGGEPGAVVHAVDDVEAVVHDAVRDGPHDARVAEVGHDPQAALLGARDGVHAILDGVPQAFHGHRQHPAQGAAPGIVDGPDPAGHLGARDRRFDEPLDPVKEGHKRVVRRVAPPGSGVVHERPGRGQQLIHGAQRDALERRTGRAGGPDEDPMRCLEDLVAGAGIGHLRALKHPPGELDRHPDVGPGRERQAAFPGPGVVDDVVDRPDERLALDALHERRLVGSLEGLLERGQGRARRPAQLLVHATHLPERVVVEAEPVVEPVLLDAVGEPRPARTGPCLLYTSPSPRD